MSHAIPNSTTSSRPVLSDHEMILEMHGRMRRVETRMTRYMEQQGFDAEGRKPTWRVNKASTNGLSCFGIVADNMLINGTGLSLAACDRAGLGLPYTMVEGRALLVQ